MRRWFCVKVLQARRPTLDWGAVDVARWHPRLPEFAAGANAISLLMPHAEPYVIAQVRAATIDDQGLRIQSEQWCAQEAAHFRLHRQFNDRLISTSWLARYLDGVGKWLFARLTRRSVHFGLAFSAAFELIAYSSARWLDANLRSLLMGADRTAATLFAWHLAEEVEHKAIVHEVLEASQAGSHTKRGTVAAFLVLIGWTVFAGLALFCSTRSALNPLRWVRLISWGFSYAFVLLPLLAASSWPGFSPRTLVDPPWMLLWLTEYDSESNTISSWDEAGLHRLMTHRLTKRRAQEQEVA